MEPNELGVRFGRLHGSQSRKDAAKDLRANGVEPTGDSVAAWRAGCEAGIADYQAAAHTRLVAYAAPYLAEARDIDSDWTEEQVFAAAVRLADEAAEEERAEEDRRIRRHVWERIDEQLRAAGLVCCGLSNKSASTYYGRDRDAEGEERIRVSDHAVAYRCSDCAVCIEVGYGSPDADVVIGETAEDAEIDNGVAMAVELFNGRCPETSEEE